MGFTNKYPLILILMRPNFVSKVYINRYYPIEIIGFQAHFTAESIAHTTVDVIRPTYERKKFRRTINKLLKHVRATVWTWRDKSRHDLTTQRLDKNLNLLKIEKSLTRYQIGSILFKFNKMVAN